MSCPSLIVSSGLGSSGRLGGHSPPLSSARYAFRHPLLGASPGEVGELETVLGEGATAVVLDLEPAWGVRLAAAASHRRLANVVLVLPRWPHANAVLPCNALIATLIGAA